MLVEKKRSEECGDEKQMFAYTALETEKRKKGQLQSYRKCSSSSREAITTAN